jgi:integrase
LIPSYRLHKASGQAITTLTDTAGNRRDMLLGKYGSPESKAAYARVIAEWQQTHGSRPVTVGKDISVAEVLLAYWGHAEEYYVKDGKQTRQLDRIKSALKPVRELYGMAPAKDFGPLALKAVRERMIAAGWVRSQINLRIGCIKRAIKWAIAEELVPPAVLHGLQAVDGLRKGRSEAKESQPVLPVPDAHVEAVLPRLTPPVAAMIRLQRLTGMRPGEVTIMRPCDIDRSGSVWEYRPESHKTEHHGHERVVYLGPQAQAVLRSFLLRAADAYCFSPAEAIADLQRRRHAARKSKVQPSQIDRRKASPKRKATDRYTARISYAQAIRRACEAAGVPPWSPNQLRHAAATEIRRRFGLEAAQVTLGHQRADTTLVYAQRNAALGERVAAEVG